MSDDKDKPDWIIEIDGESWYLTPALRHRGDKIQQMVTKHPKDVSKVKWVDVLSKPKIGLHYRVLSRPPIPGDDNDQ